jgi:hypothetical protein
VTKSADVHALVRKAAAQYGGLDFAFNNAGLVGSVAGIVETTEEDWNRVVATNLTGVWLCIKYEIPEMLKRGRGAIVNNGSVTGLVGAAGVVGNVGSKHGVSVLTKSAALQYTTQGIRVNAVAPGLVRTPTAERITTLHPEADKAMLSTVPQGRWSKPEEVAEAVVISVLGKGVGYYRTHHDFRLTEAGRRADNLDTSSLRRANAGDGKRRFVDKRMPRGIVRVSHPRRKMSGLVAEMRPAREWGQGEGCFTHGSTRSGSAGCSSE